MKLSTQSTSGTDPVTGNSTPRWLTWTTWGLQALLALAFLAAGGQKLASTEAMVQMFDQIGQGQWLRWITGGLEVVAAVLVAIPATAFIGAATIAVIMFGAIFTHLFLIGGTAVPALVLLILAGAVLWLKRPQ
ncbi:hypothetical protein ROJ8625_03742 [Roseivivax jejudonensis]|uniref:DoxX n=1 Tax=Roseivivax jejudonensis TaxID=1529041 RepID=A0A1X7A662_9RHOB|nr:DoxX family protein [Roseivivax jejudonensis]SLN71722.1 hypothetical protein ROJ8625_03742 [Roseivivax jejudonensis]